MKISSKTLFKIKKDVKNSLDEMEKADIETQKNIEDTEKRLRAIEAKFETESKILEELKKDYTEQYTKKREAIFSQFSEIDRREGELMKNGEMTVSEHLKNVEKNKLAMAEKLRGIDQELNNTLKMIRSKNLEVKILEAEFKRLNYEYCYMVSMFPISGVKMLEDLLKNISNEYEKSKIKYNETAV